MLLFAYILFTILNFILGIFFVYLFAQATKLLKEHKGMPMTIIFVTCILLISANTINNNDISPLKWENTQKEQAKTYQSPLTIPLQKNGISTYYLQVKVGIDSSTHQPIPIEAISNSTGFLSSIYWHPEHIQINKIGKNKFSYSLTGSVKWQVLKSTLFTESKYFTGTFSIE